MRVTTRTLLREFKSGLSFVGLARKYGMPQRHVEDRLRRHCLRGEAELRRAQR